MNLEAQTNPGKSYMVAQKVILSEAFQCRLVEGILQLGDLQCPMQRRRSHPND